MGEIVRIPPAAVRERLKSGEVILVCAYLDEERYKTLNLEGAISFREFESRLSSLPKDQEIVFYCS